MIAQITPSRCEGSVRIPPSKSMAHRAIIAASLAQGTSHITNIDFSDDISATIEGMRQLGADITVETIVLRSMESVIFISSEAEKFSAANPDRHCVSLSRFSHFATKKFVLQERDGCCSARRASMPICFRNRDSGSITMLTASRSIILFRQVSLNWTAMFLHSSLPGFYLRCLCWIRIRSSGFVLLSNHVLISILLCKC